MPSRPLDRRACDRERDAVSPTANERQAEAARDRSPMAFVPGDQRQPSDLLNVSRRICSSCVNYTVLPFIDRRAVHIASRAIRTKEPDAVWDEMHYSS